MKPAYYHLIEKTGKCLFLILFFSLTLSSCAIDQHAATYESWEMVYENDKEGNCVNGNFIF